MKVFIRTCKLDEDCFKLLPTQVFQTILDGYKRQGLSHPLAVKAINKSCRWRVKRFLKLNLQYICPRSTN